MLLFTPTVEDYMFEVFNLLIKFLVPFQLLFGYASLFFVLLADTF